MAFFNPELSFGDGSVALDVVDQIREGLPTNVIDETQQSGRLTAAELDRLAIPRNELETCSRRSTVGSPRASIPPILKTQRRCYTS